MGSDIFDRLDRRLVHALQVNARAPFSRIAEVLGVSDQTVARRYARLRGTGSLNVLGLTDPEALGEVRWHVRVQCTPDAAGGVAEALARREDTSWVALGSGGTEITCVTRSHPEQQDHSLLLQHLPRTPRVVGVSAHSVIHTFFGGRLSLVAKSRALTDEEVAALRPEPPEARADGLPPVLDEGDRLLLRALALDGRAGLAELASVTGWSASTVRRRMDELQACGVLFYDLEADGRILGVRDKIMVWLSVAPGDLAAAGEALAGHQEVGYACATTGSTNLLAVVLTSGPQALYRYLTTQVSALPGVVRMETAPIMRTLKGAGPYPSPRPTRRG